MLRSVGRDLNSGLFNYTRLEVLSLFYIYRTGDFSLDDRGYATQRKVVEFFQLRVDKFLNEFKNGHINARAFIGN